MTTPTHSDLVPFNGIPRLPFSKFVVALAFLSLTLTSPALAQVLFSDTFNRSDSPVLGVSETGQSWQLHSGSAGVEAGAAKPGTEFVLASVDTSSSRGMAHARVVSLSDEFWLILRLTDGANYWRFGRWRGEGYQLQQIRNYSIGTPQMTTLAAVLPAPGDALVCTLTETVIECAVNGVTVVRTSDTFNATATRIGFSSYQGTNLRFDDMRLVSLPLLPDLAVRLSGPATAYQGESVSWTATVENRGTSPATAAELNVQPPAGHPTLAFSGATCAPNAGSYRCSIGTVAAQASRAITITLNSIQAVPSLTVSISAPAASGETDTSQNAASITTRVKPPIPAGAVLVDRFERANGSSLGNAEGGQAWTDHYDPTIIRDGEAALGNAFTLSTVDAGVRIGQVLVNLAQPGPEFWLTFRVQNQSNYWRFGRWQQQAYQLQQIVGNGLATPVITTVATVMPAVGDVISCITTAQLECSVNGVVVVRSTDISGITATRVGLSGYASPGTRFDDLVAIAAPPPPDLALTITGTSFTTISTPVSWTATVQNRGPSAVTSQLVLRPHTSLAQVSITGANCVASGSSWNCPLGLIAPGQSVSVQLNATTPATGGRVTLSGSVPELSGEEDVTNNATTFSTTVRNSVNDSTYLFDSFDRPNSNELGLATTGQPWTVHSPGIGIHNGQAATGPSFSLTSVNSAVVDSTVVVTLVTPASEFWLLLRLKDSQNYWRFGRWRDEHYQLQLVHSSLLGSPVVERLATVAPAAGDILSCRITIVGIQCSVNGVPVVSTSDTTGQMESQIGLSTYNTTSARFDDLLVFGPPPSPNLALTVNAPRHAVTNTPHSAEIVVRNLGQVASSTGTLSVTIPSSLPAVAPSGCTRQSATFTCTVSPVAPSAARTFAFLITGNEPKPFSGSAVVTSPGDNTTADNTREWSTWVHTSGTAVIDHFDRADTASGLGTAVTQQVWTSLSPGFRIAGGAARADTAGAMAVVNSGFAFGTMEVVLGSNAATTAVVFRVVDRNNYFCLCRDEYGLYDLRKVVNGVSLPLAFYSRRIAMWPSPGDVVRLITRPDDGIFVAINDEHIIDAGDVAMMFEDGWGLESIGGPASVEDFAVTARIEGYAVMDRFDIADGSTLLAPTSGVRYEWRPWLGSAWVALGGRARPTSPDYTYTWIDTTTEQATVAARIVNPGNGAWVIFRLDELNNTYFRFGQTAGVYRVEFMNHDIVGTMPVSVQTLASPPAQPGDLVEVRQQPDGTVECFVNGTVTHRFVDTATNARWTLYGLAAQGSVATFDDFQVTPFGR